MLVFMTMRNTTNAIDDNIVPDNIIPCYIIPCYIIPCYIIPCYIVPCYIVQHVSPYIYITSRLLDFRSALRP